MTPRCAICRHPDLAVIDAELAQNKSLPLLARSYGFDDTTLRRHKREHQRGIAVKAQYDPISLVQDALDLKSALELKMGLGLTGTDWENPDHRTQGASTNVGLKDFAILSGQYVRTLEFIAKLTGASVRPDPKDLLPMWRRMEAKLIEWAQNQSPAIRDELYLALEAAEKETG
jgi:hypothetical protein